jgi:hypothetical protein
MASLSGDIAAAPPGPAPSAAPAPPPPTFPALLQSTVSQYTLGEYSKSACTAIALCGAAVLLPLLDAGLPVTAGHLTQAVAAGMEAAAVFEGEHCSAAEVWAVHQDSPALGGALRAFNVGAESLGSLSDAAGLEALCAQARSERGVDAARHTAIVLTKVPESVCLLLPPVAAAAGAARFAIFDSHPRPGRECAHLLSVGSLEALLAQVRQLFPALANQPGQEGWDQGVLYQYNVRCAARSCLE